MFTTFADLSESVVTVPVVLTGSDPVDPAIKQKSQALRSAQRLLTRAMEETDAAGQPASEADRARFLSLQQKGAASWMFVTGTHAEYRLSNDDVQQQLRLNLGMAPVDNAAQLCRCGLPLTHGHAQMCTKTRQAMCARHDTVVRALAQCAERAALTAHVEPLPERRTGGPPIDRLRPDLLIEGTDFSVLADVVIVMPSAPSHVAAGSARAPLRTAENAAREKIRRYKELAQREHRQIYPVAVEAYGGMIAAARELLSRMADHAADTTGAGQYQRSEILEHMRSVMAIALVRGNARLTAALIRKATTQVPRPRAHPPTVVLRSRGGRAAGGPPQRG
jgi:hypothetical protein